MLIFLRGDLLELIDELERLGADIDDINERYMGSMELYIGVLKKFVGSLKEFEVMLHFESGDTEGAVHCAHAIKGMMGNPCR